MEIDIINKLPSNRWEEYKQLRLEALEKEPLAFLSDIEDAKKQTDDYWKKRSENMLFAEYEGTLIGMVGWHREERTKNNHIANIISVYVKEEYQGKGVGSKLMREILSIIEKEVGIKKIQLGVISTQEPAIKIYKSLGFQTVGELKYALRIGDKYYNEILMEKYI